MEVMKTCKNFPGASLAAFACLIVLALIPDCARAYLITENPTTGVFTLSSDLSAITTSMTTVPEPLDGPASHFLSGLLIGGYNFSSGNVWSYTVPGMGKSYMGDYVSLPVGSPAEYFIFSDLVNQPLLQVIARDHELPAAGLIGEITGPNGLTSPLFFKLQGADVIARQRNRSVCSCWSFAPALSRAPLLVVRRGSRSSATLAGQI